MVNGNGMNIKASNENTIAVWILFVVNGELEVIVQIKFVML